MLTKRNHQRFKQLALWIVKLLFNSLWSSNTIWRYRLRLTLTQVMACCLRALSHYLNQCRLLSINENNLIASAQATILYDEFENYTFKINATPHKGQWVNSLVDQPVQRVLPMGDDQLANNKENNRLPTLKILLMNLMAASQYVHYLTLFI